MEKKLNELLCYWFGNIQDIFAELKEMGIDVYESNSEYIIAGYADGEQDVQIMLQIGGTARTIKITSWEEIYRG